MTATNPETTGLRPLRPSDVFRLKTIVDVAMSPSGRYVACVVHTCDEDADAEFASLWLYDTEHDSLSELTSGPHRDVFPRWAPSGERLAFISDRPAGDVAAPRSTNVFELDLGRPSEPRPLAVGTGAISDFVWSPDGGQLCVVMTDPEPATPYGDETARVYDSMRFSDPPFTPLIDGRFDHLWIVEPGGGMRQLTFGETNDALPAWSSEGAQIAFVSNRRTNSEVLEAWDIWMVAADGSGQAAAIAEPTARTEWDGAPAFSPAGDALVFIGADASGAHHPHPHLQVIGVNGGEPTDLLRGWDRPVGNHLLTETRRHAGAPPATWSQSGDELFFLATDRGSAQLYRVASAGGQPSAMTPADREVAAFSFDGRRDRFAAVMSAADEPTELFIGEPDGSLRQVTQLNAGLCAEVAMSDLERVAFTHPDGCALEGWLVKPADFDPSTRYPVVLRIAGGPGLAYGYSFVEDSQVLAGLGHIVCFINPRGTQSYGEAFASALDGGWVGIDYEDQMAAVDHLGTLPFVDGERIGVMGASYGGLMVNWIVTQTDRFAAAVSQRSISNLVSIMGVGPLITNLVIPDFKGVSPYLNPAPYLAKSPLTHVANVETPLLLMQAGRDCMTPVGQAQEFFVALRTLGKQARLVIYPDGDHYLRRYGKPSERVHYMNTIAEWFGEHLGAGADR